REPPRTGPGLRPGLRTDSCPRRQARHSADSGERLRWLPDRGSALGRDPLNEEEREMSVDELMTVLHKCAGPPENVPEGDLLDVEFSDRGYDSLSLLEAALAIEREHGVRLTDEEVGSAPTPRTLLEVLGLRSLDARR